MERNLKTRVSKYVSYLLRHNPGNLKMDGHGFVLIGELLNKLNERFQIDEKLIFEIVEESDRKRFEVMGDKIRALYGHTVPATLELEEDKLAKVFYHGTTPDATSRIQKTGLKPMKRRWVHLSPTAEIAMEVGLRRTNNPVILEIDAEAARKNGLRFYMATERVRLCRAVPPKYIKMVSELKNK